MECCGTLSSFHLCAVSTRALQPSSHTRGQRTAECYNLWATATSSHRSSLWMPGYGGKKNLENPSGLLFLCCILQMLTCTAEICLCYDTTQDVSKFGYGTLLRHLQGMGFDLIAKQSCTGRCPTLLQHTQHQQHRTCPPLTKATAVC